MIRSYQTKANIGIGVGFLLNVGTVFVLPPNVTGGMLLVPLAIRFAGLALFIWGCCMYALAKGRTAGWGAFGLLSLIGLIVLVCLKDFAKDGHSPEQRGFEVRFPPRKP